MPVGRFYIQPDFIEPSLCRLNKCLRPAWMETKGFVQLSKQIWDLFWGKQTGAARFLETLMILRVDFENNFADRNIEIF